MICTGGDNLLRALNFRPVNCNNVKSTINVRFFLFFLQTKFRLAALWQIYQPEETNEKKTEYEAFDIVVNDWATEQQMWFEELQSARLKWERVARLRCASGVRIPREFDGVYCRKRGIIERKNGQKRRR